MLRKCNINRLRERERERERERKLLPAVNGVEVRYKVGGRGGGDYKCRYGQRSFKCMFLFIQYNEKKMNKDNKMVGWLVGLDFGKSAYFKGGRCKLRIYQNSFFKCPIRKVRLTQF